MNIIKSENSKLKIAKIALCKMLILINLSKKRLYEGRWMQNIFKSACFLFCFVLFCFVLFCFVLFCFVLFCFALFAFVCSFFIFFVKLSYYLTWDKLPGESKKMYLS